MAIHNDTAEGERNKELFRRIILEGFGQGNLSVFDEVMAPDFVEHQAGMRPGLDSVKGTVTYLHHVMPDLHYTIEDMVASRDKVWAHMKSRGTHRGSFMGLPPTGKTIEIDVIDICRFKDGKMVEHWGVPDRFSMLEQLDLLPKQRSAA